jgi:hypothetical protein
MARIARCEVAFPYAYAANGIFGESPGNTSLDHASAEVFTGVGLQH